MSELPSILEIIKEWETDCEIDHKNITTEIIRNSKLHPKYTQLLIRYKIKRAKIQDELEEEKHKALQFYTGKIKINGKIFPEKLGSTELKSYIMNYHTVKELTKKLEAADVSIKALESILDQIKSNHYSINNLIAVRKIDAGI